MGKVDLRINGRKDEAISAKCPSSARIGNFSMGAGQKIVPLYGKGPERVEGQLLYLCL